MRDGTLPSCIPSVAQKHESRVRTQLRALLLVHVDINGESQRPSARDLMLLMSTWPPLMQPANTNTTLARIATASIWFGIAS